MLKYSYISVHKAAKFIVLLAISSAVCLYPEKALSQDIQGWLDGFIIKEIGNTGVYEGNIGVNKLFQKDGWADAYFCNTFSWDVTPWYMAEGSLELHYTKDPQYTDMTEVRPWIGMKFTYNKFFESIHLERPYFYLRLDQRFLSYLDYDTTEIKTRLRPRIGGRFILKNNALSAKTFYIPFYFEYFVNFNGDALERYASQNRSVIGLGYVFNYSWRAEFVHYTQRSRHSQEEDFEKTDVIFQLQLRYFLR
jgi:hypothetical protein